MPTLVVEDGTGVANANSYIDLTYLDAYVADRGLTLVSTQNAKKTLALKAMDYLESFRDSFRGTKAVDTQTFQWPRKDVYIDAIEFSKSDIPEDLKRSQCQLVVEQEKKTPLYPAPRTSSVEGIVTEKTMAPLTKKFAPMNLGMASPHKPIKIMSVWVFLNPLMSCSDKRLQTIRV
jgi:hypothetical protein|tara:strand:+ start:2436 stop:2963 length:528 start_codon:yes stop_codon:yes gene_type:complete